MHNRYRLVHQNNVTWVSLEPLLEDLKEMIDVLKEQNNIDILHKTEVVKIFIEALITENKIQRYKESKNDEISYKESLQ